MSSRFLLTNYIRRPLFVIPISYPILVNNPVYSLSTAVETSFQNCWKRLPVFSFILQKKLMRSYKKVFNHFFQVIDNLFGWKYVPLQSY